MTLSGVKSSGDLCILLPDDADDFIIRPAVGVDVVQILETIQSSRSDLPIPQISPGDNIEFGIGSINPLTRLYQANSLDPTTTSMLPGIKFVGFPVSILMLLKHWICTRLRCLLMFKSCHGSLRTNKCLDLIASEISSLKLPPPDLLCLLWRFSVWYLKPAAQNSD
jgi:hypothetical protein